jgi:hypothetical protein
MVPGLSPYNFGFNNPARYSDPLGLMGQDAGIWGAYALYFATRRAYSGTHEIKKDIDLLKEAVLID